MGKRATFVAAGAGCLVGACLGRARQRARGPHLVAAGAHPAELAAMQKVARRSRRAAADASAALINDRFRGP
ncbi:MULTISPECIES: hypothetical protein [unclassified Nocardioides]|uniref:hypothetical protein n=1 Tax=unclassified Nocardioides TaxID=2615069 RepID=UPI0006FECBD1|nr:MULTISPECIES: hypothetical protein [unclassified Nocardioides]KQY54232.1 hypothetical protein ASD30_18620 [Nocardioides sp. Root140]KRF10361.1 hypothetical protein ASH02_19785 [Nocardioides sp. Soil796]